MSDLLNLSGVTKTFGGLVAVNDVSFSVEQGSVMGIIGPNGAGKTTVFNLITGNYTPDRGEILFRGQSLVGRTASWTWGLPAPFSPSGFSPLCPCWKMFWQAVTAA